MNPDILSCTISLSSAFDDWFELLIKRGTPVDALYDFPDLVDTYDVQSTLTYDYWKEYKGRKISPLIYAIQCRNIALVKLLLKNKANINFPSSDGRTPMMHAVRTVN